MFADKTIAPECIRIEHLPTSGRGTINLGSATPVPESTKMLKIATFEEWETFDAEAASIGGILKGLSSDDEHRIAISRTMQLRNLRKVSINCHYESGRKRPTVGAEQAAMTFAAIVDMASDAFFIPELRRDLLCEPWDIYPIPSEHICCSARVGETFAQENANSSDSEKVDGIQTGNTTEPGVTRVIKPDLSLYNSGNDQGTMPILAVEGKKPDLQFAEELGVSDVSTGSVANKFKRLFKRVRRNRSDLKDPEVVLSLAICQALLYGLQTESACAILTNCNETIFLKVVSVKNESPQELKVAVSSLYKGNTVFCGVVACFRKMFSEDYIAKVDWKLRIDALLSLAESDPDYEPDESEHSSEGDSSTGSSTNEQTPSANKKRRGGTSAYSSANRSPFEEKEAESGSPNSVILASRHKRLPGRTLYKIINRNLGYISEFGYNRVLKCRLEEQIVAAKFFYSLEERNVPSTIEHERYMHSLMETRCEDGKYGEFVAELLAYGHVNAFGMVLMTAYVGKAVTMVHSQVLVGDEVILDVTELSSAAVTSLRRIHKLKLLHGDLSLSNIRAQEIGENDWQVWWVDFGHAKESESEAAFRNEERHCREMFQRGERRMRH